MADLTDLRAAVQKERDVSFSVITLLTDLAKRLADAIASSDPAAIQQVVDDLKANTSALAEAVAANTPAGTPTP